MTDSIGIEARIIKFLKTNKAYTSGQTISKTLGISRSAVWKHMEHLRKIGYLIEGSSNKGYRLLSKTVPFNAQELTNSIRTKTIGSELHFYNSCASTNILAFELAKNGAPEGTVVISDSQTLGKGRLGRHWHSPPGKNLYTSIILRPPILPQMATVITLMAAVAVSEAVRKFSPTPVEVKWPNDILLDSKKTAGILLEMNSEMDKINFIVLGIGVNLNMDMQGAPKELKPIATSIKEKTGKDIDRIKFAQTLYYVLEKWYKIFIEDGPRKILEAWNGYFHRVGRSVRVRGHEDIEGLCMGIDPDGALLVRLPSGRVERILAGDLEQDGSACP